jgi:hypothetical protein
MEKTHITTKGGIHQKSTKQADKGDDTATATTMEGEIKLPRDMTGGMRKTTKAKSFKQEIIGERRNQGIRVPLQKICCMVLVASIMRTWMGKESPTIR